MELLLATRSQPKVAEIRRILGPLEAVQLVDLETVGLAPTAEEEDIEAYETFEENAWAKAAHFHQRSGLPTVADDSGLVVDALHGEPGVRSKRFSPRAHELSDLELDQANNRYLLERLGDLELARRTARFVCVAALVMDGEEVRYFRGEVEGLILGGPYGQEGFGYDPLFFDRTLGKTFAQITRSEKNERSHRGKAFRALGEHLRGVEAPE